MHVAFNNAYVYPIIAVQYSEMRIDVDTCEHLHVVYALISSMDKRKHLATHASTIHMDGKRFIVTGCVGYADDNEKYPRSIELPNMRIANYTHEECLPS